MIKKLLLTTVVLSASSMAAFAADLPSRRAPPVYVPPPALPVFTWSGGYIGVNAGYAFDSNTSFRLSGNQGNTARLSGSGIVRPYSNLGGNGFTGGGTIGYNYELGGLGGLGGGLPGIGGFGLGHAGIVMGVEADAAYTDVNRTNSFGGIGALAVTDHSRTEFVGTARGRLGLAFDTIMVYGTGGFAYGGVNNYAGIQNGAGSTIFNGTRESLRTGYSYGGGVEYAIPTTSFVNVFHAGAVTVKAEYIHYDLGTTSIQLRNGAGASFTDRIHTEGNLVRAGLNYKMNFFNPAPAVVARY